MKTDPEKAAQAVAGRALREELADALIMMERAEVIDFNGHMSCRLPGTDRVLINSGRSVRSALTAADIIAIDMDGKPVEGDVAPPMEFHIHTEIYRRRPDVNAVAHTHPLWSTLFGMTGERVEPVPRCLARAECERVAAIAPGGERRIAAAVDDQIALQGPTVDWAGGVDAGFHTEVGREQRAGGRRDVRGDGGGRRAGMRGGDPAGAGRTDRGSGARGGRRYGVRHR